MRSLLLVGAFIAGCSRREEGPPHDAAPPPPVSASPPAFVLPPGFVRARAFAFNRDPQAPFCASLIARNGQLCPSALGEGVLLSRDQIDHAVAAFTAPPRRLDTAPWCFQPRHGIVLYDEADQPIAAMSVSFECEREQMWPTPRDHQYDAQPMSVKTEQGFHGLFCDELQLTPCTR